MRYTPAILAVFLIAAAATSPQEKEDLYSIPAKSKYNLNALVGKKPLTRAERTNFLETSHYEDVIAFIDSLKLLGARIQVGSIGKTALGRNLPYVVASRPLITSPAEARRLGRPIAYIQANIHSGEVEGKEASLAILRDLLFDKHKNVLDSIVLIVQPDYNADGNDHLDNQARNRGAQNGPEMVGTRNTSCGWNLNRDYVSADAPETKASLNMLNAWNPDLFMDLHTTDGSIHGYALTYSPSLAPAALTVGSFVATTMLPEIRRRMRDRDGFETNDYGDFSRVQSSGGGVPGGALGGGGFGRGRGANNVAANVPYMRPCDTAAFNRPPAAPAPRGMARGSGASGNSSLESMIADSIPTSGWAFSTYEPFARYGSNYYGLRGRLSILSEAFSHDPFARRVASTYDFVSEVLSYVAEHRREIANLEKASVAHVATWANHPETAPALALRTRMDTTRIEDIRVEMVTLLSDSSKREPGMGNRQRTGIIKLVKMPMMVSFAPTLTRTLPYAYAFSAKTAAAIRPILTQHGIQVEKLTAPSIVTAESFTIDTVIDRGQSESARRMRDAPGTWTAPTGHTLPAGTYVVRASQPFGLLAFYLLEPQGEDGLLQWGFFEGMVGPHATFPVIRITEPAVLHARPSRN